jgi:hypothetical protein
MAIVCDGPIYEETGIAICRYDPSDTEFDCADCVLEREEPEEEAVPNPGSDAAVGQGCLCPTSTNNQGQGFALAGLDGPNFCINPDCPLHGWKEEEQEQIPTTADWGE